MSDVAVFLTPDSFALLQTLLDEARRKRSGTPARTHVPEYEGTAPEVYIARTSDSGIPAFTAVIGTGTGPSPFDMPGKADCSVYRVLDVGTAGPTFLPLDPLVRTVYNLSQTSVDKDSWVLVIRDKFGSWWVADNGSTDNLAVVRILDVIAAQQLLNCPVRDPWECPAVYHHAVKEMYDPLCDVWTDGACVYVSELLGRKLELGRRYIAKLAGPTPKILSAASAPVPPVGCTFVGGESLYQVDVGIPIHIIQVNVKVGDVCPVGTGSGTGSGPYSTTHLIIYSGAVYRWDQRPCMWVLVESPIYIANANGCLLDSYIGKRIEGIYDSMIRSTQPIGTGTATATVCTALYLTQQPIRSGVSDVQCIGGRIRVFMYDDCGNSVYSHDAGCCDVCGGGTGTGTGPSGCPCTGVPTANNFTGTIALTAGTCTNCSALTSFILTLTAPCTWLANTLPDVCGFGTMGASLTYISSSNTFQLFFGGGGGSTSSGAIYSIAAGSFNCNGVNVLSLISSNGGCKWPSTVTLTPV